MNPLSVESRVIRNLKRLPLVEVLDDELWTSVLPHLFVTQLEEGETLFKSGRSSENLYVVVEGELGLCFDIGAGAEPLELQTRGKGDTAGDFAVLNGGEHIVSAIAKRRTRLGCFPREAFELLSNIAPDILAHVYDTAADLSHSVMMARVYCQLFGEIDAETLRALLDASTLHHLENGETLFREEDQPDGLYVVIAGRFNIDTTNNKGQQVRVAEVRTGETIGEYGLLTESQRYATVYATRESMVAKLPRETFDSFIMTNPVLLASVTKLLVKRQLLNVRGKIRRASDTNFVVIPLDDRLPTRRLVLHMVSAFSPQDSPMILDKDTFDTMYGKSGASSTAFTDPFSSSISAWMDDKETHFSHVLYIADNSWNAWTQRCINRADKILLVANARLDNDESIRPIEKQLAEIYKGSTFKPRIELVLAHPSNTEAPRETARWLRGRKIDAFHHIRIGDRKHIQRLQRRLTGKALGMVFSGGGARGYAHLGVHRAIEETGLDFDYVGGSSMGGLLGAAMAMGMSYEDIYEKSKQFANSRALFDYTLPIVSLMRSRKLTRFCKTVYEDVRIEDLWIPYFCVSSNLSNGAEVIHQRGYLWKAVRTTISLPGIFSPIPTMNGELLTDGSVLNNFPVDVMDRLLSGGSLLGVDVSQIGEIKKAYSFGTSVSGWQVFFSRINPFMKKFASPRMIETLFRATDIKGFQRISETRELLDILIVPDVSQITLLDFKSFPQISEIGYEAALKVLIPVQKEQAKQAANRKEAHERARKAAALAAAGRVENPQTATTNDNADQSDSSLTAQPSS